MNLQIKILLTLVYFCPFILLSQTTTDHYWTVCVAYNNSLNFASNGYTINVCQGDTLTFGTGSGPSSGCGGLQLINSTSNCTGTVCSNVHEPDINTDYQGGSISFETDYVPYTQYPTCLGGDELTFTIVPTQNDTLILSWLTVRINLDCEGNPASINNFYHYGEVFINVIPMPTPVLSTTTPVVQPVDNITLTIDSCMSGVRAYLIEECDSFDINNLSATHTPQFCNGNDSIVMFPLAPGYITELKYFAIFERYDNCNYDYTYSNIITIDVEELPNPNACSEPDILNTESLLADQGNHNRKDYHYYTVTNLVCSTCDINSVWDFLKSDVKYQVPLMEDFETPIHKIANYLMPKKENFPSAIVGHCQSLEVKVVEIKTNSVILGYLTSNANYSDPVMTVIDEDCKCITNYTLDGHTLHPGKVRRCITLDGCEEVKAITTGTGFHFTGDNEVGKWFADENKEIGTIAFGKVDARLLHDFNN